HVFHRPEGAVGVARVDRSRQAVSDAVGNLNRMIEVAAFDDRNDRAEDFFLLDAHPLFYAREHGRLDEEAMFQVAAFGALAAAHQLRFVFVLANFYVAQNLFERRLIDDRADVSLVAEAVAQAQALRAINQHLREFPGHFLMNDDTRRGRAALTGGAEP